VAQVRGHHSGLDSLIRQTVVSKATIVSAARRHFEWLVIAPALGALLFVWFTAAFYMLEQRTATLARVKTRLGATAAILADVNELATVAGPNAAAGVSRSRSAAIERALQQYPTASIWVEKDGVVLAGQSSRVDPSDYLMVQDARKNFSVRAAVPLADVLARWRKRAYEGGAILLLLSGALFLLTQLLVRALRQRAKAEHETAAAEERAAQHAIYRWELERTVAERTADLERAKSALETELIERRAAERALREHDALLNVVTKSAAELLGAHHEEGISAVLEMIGRTVSVGRVQLAQISMDSTQHLRSSVRYEWCAPGEVSAIGNAALQDIDLSAHLPRSLGPANSSGPASFFVADVSATYRGLFEQARMRSFLQLPVMVEDRLWGSLNFIDSSGERREWSWAESDTLKTLAGLMGVAIARAQYAKEVADANMIVQNSPTILYRLKGEPPLPLTYVSHNIRKFGHDPERLVGDVNGLEALVVPQDVQKVKAALARALESDAEAGAIEFRLRSGTGAHRWVESRYRTMRDKDGRPRELEGIIIDITERKAAEEKIAQLARTDGLTGLANRGAFLDRLRQAFAAARRSAGAFAVLYIDLDHFKDVNDTLGHPFGDALLRQVSQRLRSVTRDTDIVARLGGDEFAILQSGMQEPAEAGALAEKISRTMQDTYLIEDNRINISASIGICFYSAACQSPDAMLAQADLALYRSKEEGRNRYHFHSEDLDRQVLRRVRLAEELRKALEQGQLELYYQPQVELLSGKIAGMEALLRWHHPKRGVLGAASFIAVAEKAGLRATLGRWIIDQACRQMSVWCERALAPPQIAVNLSLSQLKNGRELVRSVKDSLRRWNIEASRLELDVTEATLAQATPAQRAALRQLCLLGVRIAIDDFGTEHSLFEHLRTFRVSQLKTAQSFVTSAGTDPERAAFVRATLHLARELNIGVVAEGVETGEQRRFLAATGSTMIAQGHYFSEAVRAPRAEELLRQGWIDPKASAAQAEVTDQMPSARGR
jgi:diguanylate cyclase (GGDEF)-like protein/PAS domain S-box-containing protein